MNAFDKYAYYRASVQSPDEDVLFFAKTFRELTKREPILLREDFCGAFALSCGWVQSDPKRRAIGVDLDPEPLNYGQEMYLSRLMTEERSRLNVLQQNVLASPQPTADLIVACNFSYFCFKDRNVLKQYLKLCHESLSPGGLLLMDSFGGPACCEPNETETEHDDFSYFWDQDTYNPITHEALFHIHFQRKGEPRREKVFTYDWRLWTIPEIRELMTEVGFRSSYVYWEGSDEEGEGNGEFTQSEEGDLCESWLAYIVGAK